MSKKIRKEKIYMKYNFKIGAIDFSVVADKETLIEKAKNLRTFEEGCFVPIGGDELDILSEEDFNYNLNKFIKNIENACQDYALIDVINKMPKKKNGTLMKRRKEVVSYYENSVYFCEWYPAWATFELRFTAVSDTTLELQIWECNYQA